MSYRIQIFHPESGFFINTNHESDDSEKLIALVRSGVFAGVRIRMVDSSGDEVPLNEVVHEKKGPLTVEDLANILGVPILDPKKLYGDE